MTDNDIIEMLALHLHGVANCKIPTRKGVNDNVAMAKHLKALQYSAANMLSIVQEHQSLKEFNAGLAHSLAAGNITIVGDVVTLTDQGRANFDNIARAK